MRDTRNDRSKRRQQPEEPRLPSTSAPSDLPIGFPTRARTFLGREQDLDLVTGLLSRPGLQLVTITGPPGVGKTRLALESCRILVPTFKERMYFVDLAALNEPRLVIPAIAHALGIRESRRPATSQIAIALGRTHTVLLLDNFEHVRAAAGSISELISACPRLKIIATSRMPLGLDREQEVPLEPLPLPQVDRHLGSDELPLNPAVALFVDRARAILPKFEPSGPALEAVAEICRALDGLPLAIELAAAHIKIFTPSLIVERLRTPGERTALQLPQEPRADLPHRHQTLADAVQWSYELLGPDDQAVFRWMAVFRGGCSLDAAEAVCRAGLERSAVFPSIAALVDHSLLMREILPNGQPRLRMLEPIREDALNRLRAAGEAVHAVRHHADYYHRIALESESDLRGPNQVRALDRLEQDLGNLRDAMQWLIDHQDGRRAMETASALFRLWRVRGRGQEGIEWLRRSATASRDCPPEIRSLAIARLATLLRFHGQGQEALELAREAHAAAVAAGHGMALVHALNILAICEPLDARQQLLEEARVLCRELRDPEATVRTLNNLAVVRELLGDVTEASRLLEEAVSLARMAGDPFGMILPLLSLAEYAMNSKDMRSAAARVQESLGLAQDLGFVEHVARGLTFAALFADGQGQLDAVARLLGASEALAEGTGVVAFGPISRGLSEHLRVMREHLRSALSPADISRGRADGRLMSLSDAVAEAARVISETLVNLEPASRATLTNRERAVANQVAQGRSNREIAKALFIGERTVETHVQNILNKLGFHSRSQIAAWIGEQRRP